MEVQLRRKERVAVVQERMKVSDLRAEANKSGSCSRMLCYTVC
jgi:hypothetical protein